MQPIRCQCIRHFRTVNITSAHSKKTIESASVFQHDFSTVQIRNALANRLILKIYFTWERWFSSNFPPHRHWVPEKAGDDYERMNEWMALHGGLAFLWCSQEHWEVVRGGWRQWEPAAGLAPEKPAPLQPALWQAEGSVSRAGHGQQLRPDPGLTSHTKDAQGTLSLHFQGRFRTAVFSTLGGAPDDLAHHHWLVYFQTFSESTLDDKPHSAKHIAGIEDLCTSGKNYC